MAASLILVINSTLSAEVTALDVTDPKTSRRAAFKILSNLTSAEAVPPVPTAFLNTTTSTILYLAKASTTSLLPSRGVTSNGIVSKDRILSSYLTTFCIKGTLNLIPGSVFTLLT